MRELSAPRMSERPHVDQVSYPGKMGLVAGVERSAMGDRGSGDDKVECSCPRVVPAASDMSSELATVSRHQSIDWQGHEAALYGRQTLQP